MPIADCGVGLRIERAVTWEFLRFDYPQFAIPNPQLVCRLSGVGFHFGKLGSDECHPVLFVEAVAAKDAGFVIKLLAIAEKLNVADTDTGGGEGVSGL